MSEHTLLGCLMGEALGGTCATGALAGMGQALYAGYLEANPTNLSDQAVNANAELIAGLFAALGSGGNVNATMIASGIGLSGFVNNRQFHRAEIEWLRANAQKFADEMGISYEEALRRLTRQAASQIDSLYANEGGDAQAAAFIERNKPKGVIVGTGGDGSYVDHNQEWFTATDDQYANHLINLSTVVNQSDFYIPLDAYAASGNGSEIGDAAIFVSTRLSEGGSIGSLQDLSPSALIDVLETAKSQLLVVLEGEHYTTTQKLQASQAFGVNVFWGILGNDLAGASEEQLEQISRFHGLSQAIQLELLPALAIEGSRLEDGIPNPAVEQFRKNYLSDSDLVQFRGRKGDWNKELNNPQPNTYYKLDNGDIYITDDQGRVFKVQSELRIDPNDRNSYRQGVAGGDCRQPGDCGGHLIAAVFGGAGEAINLVPMDKILNGCGWQVV